MGRALAILVVAMVWLAGCGDDLAQLYQEEDHPAILEPKEDTTSILRGDTGLGDMTPPERVPAAPLVATRPPAKRQRILRLLCSPSAKHLFGDVLEESFEEEYPGIDLLLLEAQDRSCIGSVIMQNAVAAIVGVPLSANESNRGLVTKIIGYHIAVLVVHRDNKTTSLFSNQMEKVLDGRIHSWSEVGWQHLQIQPVFEHPSHRNDPAAKLLRMTGKAAHVALLMPDGHQVIDYVGRHRRALGLVTLAQFEQHKGKVRYLEINTVRPILSNYLRGAYPLGCTFWMVHGGKRHPQLNELSSFLRSRKGRRVLERHLTLPYLRSKNR
jgi:hypothetical protein